MAALRCVVLRCSTLGCDALYSAALRCLNGTVVCVSRARLRMQRLYS